jgi:hypothetical protein
MLVVTYIETRNVELLDVGCWVLGDGIYGFVELKNLELVMDAGCWVIYDDL